MTGPFWDCRRGLRTAVPRFGDNLLEFQVVCPQNGTAVKKRFKGTEHFLMKTFMAGGVPEGRRTLLDESSLAKWAP